MAKTAMIRARTTPGLKSDVEGILKRLGLNTTEAINLFFSQVKLHRGLPFEVRIPNKTTRETLKKADKGKELNTYKGVDEFFEKMGV